MRVNLQEIRILIKNKLNERGDTMSHKQNFIKTTDKETADKLISEGFQLVSQDGSIYTFLNQIPTNFSFDGIDIKKMTYTNMLSL